MGKPRAAAADSSAGSLGPTPASPYRYRCPASARLPTVIDLTWQWSDPMVSIVPSASPAHSASTCGRARSGGATKYRSASAPA